MQAFSVTMAQVNPTVGDIAGNRDKVLRAIRQARLERTKLVVLPELVLTGYPPEDLLHHNAFVQDNIKALHALIHETQDIVAIIGFVDKDSAGRLFNAAAVIANKKLLHVYHKMDLPNYGVFDEKRYFTPGTKGCVLDAGNGLRIGVTICEDIWLESSLVRRPPYRNAASILVNISASPYQVGKLNTRDSIVRGLAKKIHSTVIYENLVGGQDELVFDGSSLVVDASGKVLVRQPHFGESVQSFEIPFVLTKTKLRKDLFDVVRIPSIPENTKETFQAQILSYKKPLVEKEVYDALVLGTRDYVQKNKFKQVVIGLSGGIDSALVACIAVDAIGRKNVLGVTMPSRYTSNGTKNDAYKLSKNLGIDCIELPIQPLCRAYEKSLKKIFAKTKPNVAEENLQARIRGNLLMAISNKWGALVLTTGNKSEMATGYCTLYGDMAGGFAVIKDIPKTLVYRLSRYRNGLSAGPVIPISTIRRAPSAELRPNQKDQDSLPPYSQLDRFLEAYIEGHESIGGMVRRGIPQKLAITLSHLVDGNEYKRRQAPPGIKITSRAFGKDRRMPITNRYRPEFPS